MEVLVDALGITPLEAITCATKNNAIAMQAQGELGTIDAGSRADVIVVDGDPLADIRILNDRSRLRAVISRGTSIDLSGPWPQWNSTPGWKVSAWAERSLTHDIAYPRP